MHPTVADSAGITIVTNGGPQWAHAEGWTVAVEPDLRIGVLEGDEEYEFHDIAAAALQSDGDLVVADARTATVRLYDPDGVFKQVLGSAGSGPGEFGRPGHIVIGVADSVFVWDGVGWRLTKFSPEGEYVETETFTPARIGELAAPPFYPDSVIPLRDGTYLVRLADKGDVASKSGKAGAAPANDAAASGNSRRRAAALRASIDSVTTRLLARFSGTEQVWVESPWGPLAVAPALARTASISVQPNEPRACIGDQETTEIRCFEGNASTIVRWQADPIGVDADGALIAEWRESTLESFEQKLSRAAARQLVEQVPVPAFLPAYAGVVLDRTGHVWVERGSSERSRAGTSEFLVFTPAGLLLGFVEVPNVRIMEIGSDYVLGVREDELGVQYLELYRLDRSAS